MPSGLKSQHYLVTAPIRRRKSDGSIQYEKAGDEICEFVRTKFSSFIRGVSKHELLVTQELESTLARCGFFIPNGKIFIFFQAGQPN